MAGEYKKLSEDHPTIRNYVNSLTVGVRSVLAKLGGHPHPEAEEAAPATNALPHQAHVNSLTQGVRRVLEKSRAP